MHHGSMRYSHADQQYAAICLGRQPQGVLGVAARRPSGEPTVIINLPLIRKDNNWQPFPTLYWLIDPDLNTKIAQVERKGGVRAIESALTQDPALLQAHREDNTHYAKARWAVLNETEKQAAIDLGMQPMLEHTGIAGIANHDAVKCLHAQYAFHLARNETGTTVGKLMQERFDLPR